MSQEQLAVNASLYRSYIGDIERGVRNVSLRNIEKIALALKTTMSVLLSDCDKGDR